MALKREIKSSDFIDLFNGAELAADSIADVCRVLTNIQEEYFSANPERKYHNETIICDFEHYGSFMRVATNELWHNLSELQQTVQEAEKLFE